MAKRRYGKAKIDNDKESWDDEEDARRKYGNVPRNGGHDKNDEEDGDDEIDEEIDEEKEPEATPYIS